VCGRWTCGGVSASTSSPRGPAPPSVTGGNTASGRPSRPPSRGPRRRLRPSLRRRRATRSLVEEAGRRYAFSRPRHHAAACRPASSPPARTGSARFDISFNSAGVCPLGEVLEFGREKWIRRSPSPHRSIRAEPRGGEADDPEAPRQDRQHLLRLHVPRQVASRPPTPPRRTGSPVLTKAPTATSFAVDNIQSERDRRPATYATAMHPRRPGAIPTRTASVVLEHDPARQDLGE
jgi:hypothetical protein